MIVLGNTYGFKYWIGALKYAVTASRKLYGPKELWLEETNVIPKKVYGSLFYYTNLVYLSPGGNFWLAKDCGGHLKSYRLVID